MSSEKTVRNINVLIIGASAAGLMCAIEAAKRGRSVLVIDHANKPGKKILMSGGGRCNFTNYSVSADNYLSQNPHFCKSALSQFTQWDFIQMVENHNIAYHERDHGQLFCDHSAKDILTMLLAECQHYSVEIKLNSTIDNITRHKTNGFQADVIQHDVSAPVHCESLVVASGGLSIPKMCASPIGYRIAEQFHIPVIATRAGLVPFTLHEKDKQRLNPLSGIAVYSEVSNHRISFTENILFTHRGLSGPAILQISSYWFPGEILTINLLPNIDLLTTLLEHKQSTPNKKLRTILGTYLPKRLIDIFIEPLKLDSTLHHLKHQQLDTICHQLQSWQLQPNGTEGYRTAEVTLGGVDTNALSSKTMGCKTVSGLYFIGEIVDVTGWLGGYNFQWAWSSGWCAGQNV